MDDLSDTQRRIEAPLTAFLAYWRRLQGAAGMPRRGDFQPSAIPRLLPGLTIVEPLGERFRIRLIGTEVQARIKRPVRAGMMLDELETGRYLAFLTRVYGTVLATQQPVLSRTRYDGARGLVFISRLTVPFAGAAGTVAQLMSLLAFSHARDPHDAIETLGDAEAVHVMQVLTDEGLQR